MSDPDKQPRRERATGPGRRVDKPSPIPARFREDYDPEPWTDPKSGVTYPIDPRDVLDPAEYRDYRRGKR